jgi:predicted DNA binding CopG/RHH family protein
MALTKQDLSEYKTTRTGTGRTVAKSHLYEEHEVDLRFSESLCNAVSSVTSVAVTSGAVASVAVTSGAVTSVAVT